MSVRAKFRVESKVVNEGGDEAGTGAVTLVAVTSGSKENDDFFRYTPSGRLQMGLVNVAALAQFEIGDEFYIDFTKAGVNRHQ